MTLRPGTTALLAALAAASCNNSKGGGASDGGADAAPDATLGATCAEQDDPHCDNPVSRALIPHLRGAGIAPRDADAAEVCRRMAVDLIGRIPKPAELATCRTQTPAQMADTFMAMPEYARTQRRAWGERLSYDSYRMWHGHVVDLDDLVASLYRGDLRYDDFAGRVVTHPGFYARHQGDDWSALVVSTFLGRTARPDELAGLRPLTRIWSQRRFCDGAVYWNLEKLGVAEDDAKLYCSLSFEWGLNPCACQPGLGSPGCRSTTLGRTVDFGMEGCTGDLGDLVRAANARWPGLRSTCADGTTGCRDLDLGDRPLEPLRAMSAGQRLRLDSLGQALAARGEFWEAAADHELRALLGWWQTSFSRPTTDVPEVRAVLADELRRTGSLRDVQKLVVTSLLYTAPASPPPAVTEPPLWSMGPTKLLGAESWLDSAGVAVGETLGVCDFRAVTSVSVEFGFIWADQALTEKQASTLGTSFSPARYQTAARALGGCTADQARPAASSVGLTLAEDRNAQLLCALGSAVLPAGFKPGDSGDGALDAGVRHLYEQVLARSASDAEVTAMRADMRACLAAGKAAGCAGPEEAIRWACHRLIDSAEFGLY